MLRKKGTRNMKNKYWKKFEETGYVSDYLEYARIKSDSVDKEGVIQNESGNSDRNGSVSDADWRV